jgi:hypothetical protein
LAHHRLPVLSLTETLWQNLSQFFPILSDLKCYIGTPSQALTNHLRNAKPEDQPKNSSKENKFF